MVHISRNAIKNSNVQKGKKTMEENSNLNEKLKEVDDRIAELKKSIQLSEALEELHKNEHFKLVFLDGYFEDEAKRLFGVLVTPSTLKRDVIENIQEKLSSIRNVKQYFAVILQNAHMAPDQIVEEEEFRKKITAAFDDGDEE